MAPVSRWTHTTGLLALLTLAACDGDGITYSPQDPAPDAMFNIPVLPVVDAGPDNQSLPVHTPCKPTFTGCQGRCGRIQDLCTLAVHECGECPKGNICDLMTNRCIKAEITCKDLKAECGTIKNSCGKRLDCGTCPKNQECNPDTNRCVTCKNVTCQDLGHECGQVWLGCGAKTNLTECGQCSSSKKCNTAFNICEPACKPKSKAALCAAAKASLGVQCGFITNGCGGIVNCGGCPSGQGCGIYGVANRCEVIMEPDECKARGKDCGTLKSICGGTINCGTCPKGQVCNSNNVCGPPCKPRVCGDLKPKECGVFSDGCNGTLTCKCSAKGAVCLKTGKCCVNTAVCKPGSCDTKVTNTCTGAKISCKCSSGQICDKTTNTCKGAKDCATYSAGGTSSKCNDNKFYKQTDNSLFACPCSKPDWWCINDSPTKEGSCCKNINPSCPKTGPGSCNSSVINSCTGAVTKCTCPPGYYCSGNTCLPYDTCSKFSATGKAGDPCSNGPSPSFPNGGGGYLTCRCKSGLACVDASGKLVSGGTTGTCKIKKTCADYKATGNVGEICSNDPSPSFPNGAGTNLTCRCKSAYACADGKDARVSGGATGYCKLKKTCADYSATGAVGAPCNSSKYFSDGYGVLFACPCKLSGGYYNNKCLGESSTAAGVCRCTPAACTCANSGLSDGCGGTLSCACPSGQSCNKKTAKCCPTTSCTNPPAGYPANVCGTVKDSCLGSSYSCSCKDPKKPNNKCVLKSGQVWGSCVCTPNTCAKLGVGTWPNDGCGKPITCGG